MLPNSNLLPFIRSLPKAELHLHLEGSIQPETLREMARRKGAMAEEAESWIEERKRCGFRYPQFRDFLNAFKLLSLLLQTPEDYQLATERLMQELSAQGVRYAEVTLSAGVVLWKTQPLEAIFEAVAEAAKKGSARLGLKINWIFDAVRQFGVDSALQVVKHAARFREHGVVAFGIGGDEVRAPARLFADVYRQARELGLRTTAHAGEAAGPESVREAVEVLGAERIGHGTSAARDPDLLRMLAERQISVEVCLTSNLATGAIARIEDHPLRRFLEAGVRVTLNSDDPAMFATSLEREIILAAESFELSREEILGLVANGFRSAFLPEAARSKLLDELARAGNETAPNNEEAQTVPRSLKAPG